MTSTKYSLEDRHRAAAALVSGFTSIAASMETSIPASTIRHWRQHDEDFAVILQKLMAEIGESMKFKYVKIIEESADQVLDRLRHGDFQRDKTGALTRVPLKGRDLTLLNAICFDKLRLIENAPTAIVQRQDSHEHIRQLAQQFAELSKAGQ